MTIEQNENIKELSQDEKRKLKNKNKKKRQLANKRAQATANQTQSQLPKDDSEIVTIKYKLACELMDTNKGINFDIHKYVVTWVLLDGIAIPAQSKSNGKNFMSCASFEQMQDFASRILSRNVKPGNYKFKFEEEEKGKITSVNGMSWL